MRKTLCFYTAKGLLILVCALVLTASARAQDTPAPQLSLHLSITPVSGDPKSFDVHVDLINHGKDSVQLAAVWPSEQDKGSYEDYLRYALHMKTDPEVPIPTAQTEGGQRVSPQPEKVLKPGEKVAVQWRTECGCLKPRKDALNTAPCLRFSGHYDATAEFRASLSNGSNVTVVSNKAAIDFDGSSERPKASVAKVVKSSPTKKTVVLNRGSDWKIAKGERFTVRASLGEGWLLEAADVYTTGTLCTATSTSSDPNSSPADAAKRYGVVPLVGSPAVVEGTDSIPNCDK